MPTSAVASNGVRGEPVNSFGEGVGGTGAVALLFDVWKAFGGGCLGRMLGCALGAAFFAVAKHRFVVNARRLCVCGEYRMSGLLT